MCWTEKADVQWVAFQLDQECSSHVYVYVYVYVCVYRKFLNHV
jgi:hypothetical protein